MDIGCLQTRSPLQAQGEISGGVPGGLIPDPFREHPLRGGKEIEVVRVLEHLLREF